MTARFEKQYSLAKELGVPPKKVANYLQKALGQKVKKGEVIAFKKGLLGKKEILSPVTGVLDSLTDQGVLKVKVNQAKKAKRAPAKTTAAPKGQKIKGQWGKGQQVRGKLNCFSEKITVLDLNDDYQGQILALAEVISQGLWHKAKCLGAAGIICGRLPDDDFSQQVQKEYLIVNGQQKDIGLSVVVLGNDGQISQDDWSLLRANQGKEIILFGDQKIVLIPDD
jgi:hypothetical protein